MSPRARRASRRDSLAARTRAAYVRPRSRHRLIHRAAHHEHIPSTDDHGCPAVGSSQAHRRRRRLPHRAGLLVARVRAVTDARSRWRHRGRGAVRAQRRARDSQPAAPVRARRAGLRHFGQAGHRRLVDAVGVVGRRAAFVAHGGDGLAARPRHADRHRGRHRQVLQWLDSRRAHHDPHARRRNAAGDERLADVRAQSQGRQREHPRGSPRVGSPVLSRGRHLRLACGRALVRPGTEPGRLPRSAWPLGALRTGLRRARGTDGVRALRGDEQGLRAALGQSVQDHRAVRLQRVHALELGRRSARLVLRHRRPELRRAVLRLSPAHRRRADAAQVGLRLHPVQAALRHAAGADGRGEGLSRSASAHRRARRGLVPLHEDGRDGHGSGQVARSRRDEQAAARDELPHDDQRLAALHPGGPLLRHGEQARVAHAPLRRHAHHRAAVRSRGLGPRYDEPRRGALVLGCDQGELRRQRIRFLLGGSDGTGPSTQRCVPPHRPGHRVLQRLSAASHRRDLRRVPPRPAVARAHARARRVHRRAAQRHDLLVVRHLSHVGHIQASDPDGHQLRRERDAVLEHRHRGMAVPARDAQA